VSLSELCSIRLIESVARWSVDSRRARHLPWVECQNRLNCMIWEELWVYSFYVIFRALHKSEITDMWTLWVCTIASCGLEHRSPFTKNHFKSTNVVIAAKKETVNGRWARGWQDAYFKVFARARGTMWSVALLSNLDQGFLSSVYQTQTVCPIEWETKLPAVVVCCLRAQRWYPQKGSLDSRISNAVPIWINCNVSKSI
jgi:hypothetical protein